MNWFLAYIGRDRFSHFDAFYLAGSTTLISHNLYWQAAAIYALGIVTTIGLTAHSQRYDRR